MRSAFALGLLATVTIASSGLQTAEEVVEIIDGVLIGALTVTGVEGLDTCIKDFTPLATTMNAAVTDFEHPTFHNISDGIYNLGQFISQISTIMNDCAAVSDEDVAKLTAMGDAFLHPKKLTINAAHNILINGIAIDKDITAAGTDMSAGNYEKAGEQYGTIAALVLWGKDTDQAELAEALEFLQ